MPVKTKKVVGRRKLCFETMDQLEEEIERLATTNVQCLGNWSLGQILAHLARVQTIAIDGAPFHLPYPQWLTRLMAPLVKWWIFTKGMPAGLPHAGLPVFGVVREANTLTAAPDIDTKEGLADIRTAIQRYRSAEQLYPHPGFGNISRDEWDQFNLRHAELHLSFVVPESDS